MLQPCEVAVQLCCLIMVAFIHSFIHTGIVCCCSKECALCNSSFFRELCSMLHAVHHLALILAPPWAWQHGLCWC
jgi:hypothetical protein